MIKFHKYKDRELALMMDNYKYSITRLKDGKQSFVNRKTKKYISYEYVVWNNKENLAVY